MRFAPLLLTLFAPALGAQNGLAECPEPQEQLRSAACREVASETAEQRANRMAGIARLRPASDDPETLAAFREYAATLIEASGWPLVFDEFFVITSSPGGIELIFRVATPAATAAPPTGLDTRPLLAAFAKLTLDEKRAHWQAAFCRPELETLVRHYGLFSAGVWDEPGFQANSARCLPEDEQDVLRKVGAARSYLYRWQWDLREFRYGEVLELAIDNYRQAAARIGLPDVWPFIKDEPELDSEFREWLEATVLAPPATAAH